MADQKEYTLANSTFTLSAPASQAVNLCIVTLISQNRIYALGAAVGACWRGEGRPTAKIQTFDHDFAQYGKTVVDDLFKRGVTIDELMTVGSHAFALVAETLPNFNDVEETSDFFEGQGESTG